MQKIKYSLITLLISLTAYGIYVNPNHKEIVAINPIDAIMSEPQFQASMKIQAENIMLDRQKTVIEKRKEELRREELNLASTTKSVLK